MRCSSCGTNNPSTNNFCAKCGNALIKPCAKCNAENPTTSDFCGKCGAPLTNGAGAAAVTSSSQWSASSVRVAPESSSPEALDGERKTVTALFADIKGATELMRDLDPEEARAIVDPVLQLMMDAVHRYGGYVAQCTGDGIFAIFGAPVAHEDHPQRALHAALAMQEDLHRYADRLRADGKIPAEARVGVNTGEVVVRTVETGGHREYTPVGHVTNLAARMQTAAPAGSIAASEATQRLCEGYFEFRALGATAVKGLNAPIEVYEVLRAGPLRTHFQLSTRQGLTKFVGREHELEQMKRALGHAATGHGQVLALMGEPGNGKSRLIYEFRATLPGDWKVLEVSTVSHGKASAYLPVIDLFKAHFEIADQDDPTTRREKIAVGLSASEGSLGDLPSIYGLLGILEGPDPLTGLHPQVRRRRTLESLKRILLGESLKQPVAVIFENLHWVDRESQAFLDLLVDNIISARVLLLVSYRPEYRHEWVNRPHYTQVRLDPLGSESAAQMLDALLGSQPELGRVKGTIIEKTGGNPFFIEELVRALFEQRVLLRNGVVSLGKPLTAITIPFNVQGILASRVDRLPVAEKELLQVLAILGDGVPLSLVKHVAAAREDELARMLSDLHSTDLIYQQSTSPESGYAFKHALVREVAYNSVLIERRKVLHEQAGQAIEVLFKDALDDHLTELAHHYSHSANTLKAVDYLQRSGQQAGQRVAYAEGIAYFNRGLEVLASLPDERERLGFEFSIQLALGQQLLLTEGAAAAQTLKAFARAREIAVQIGPISRPHVLSGLVYLGVDFRLAHQIWEPLLAIGESIQQPAVIAEASYCLGMNFYFRGKLPPAREFLARAISLLTPDPSGYVAGISTALALTELFLGFPRQALQRGREALHILRSSKQPFVHLYAFLLVTALHRFRGDVDRTSETAAEGIALAAKHGAQGYGAVFSPYLAWALAERGNFERGFSEIHRSVTTFKAVGVEVPVFVLRIFTEINLLAGRADDGLEIASEALRAAAKKGEEAWNAELMRLRGELLLMKDPTAVGEAEDCFRDAIEISRQNSGKFWELRAVMSFARLLGSQSKRDEARAMLAEIYGWFTEGFDTADLKDAKALLDKLSD
jgi:class 3 adenylate cyclase/tetratricopeptide (TPR) repeat protein